MFIPGKRYKYSKEGMERFSQFTSSTWLEKQVFVAIDQNTIRYEDIPEDLEGCSDTDIKYYEEIDV